MAAIALNTYKTIRSDIPVGITTVYTAPIGVSSIILFSRVANVSSGITTITVYHGRGGNPVELLNQFEIPPNDALSVFADERLVLESGDTLEMEGFSNGTMKTVISVLESAK
jgi:hypothetical protein